MVGLPLLLLAILDDVHLRKPRLVILLGLSIFGSTCGFGQLPAVFLEAPARIVIVAGGPIQVAQILKGPHSPRPPTSPALMRATVCANASEAVDRCSHCTASNPAARSKA